MRSRQTRIVEESDGSELSDLDELESDNPEKSEDEDVDSEEVINISLRLMNLLVMMVMIN